LRDSLVSAGPPASTPLPFNSIANAVQLDASGNLYLAGFFFASSSGGNPPAHAFVAKLSPDASQTLWWTTLGGSKDDRGQAVNRRHPSSLVRARLGIYLRFSTLSTCPAG
jgi:hypothetical protein